MILTLPTLLANDPGAPDAPIERRFRCPLPECAGKSGRSLSLNTREGVWKCWRCGASGRLGDTMHRTRLSEREREDLAQAKAQECRRKLREAWRSAGIGSLLGTPGARYLQRERGLNPHLAAECRVKFARSWYGRPAVLFPLYWAGCGGPLEAAQGRFLQPRDDGPKAITCGPASQGAFWTPLARTSITVAICEAPIDALSLYALGIPALALCGTAARDWLPSMLQGRRVLLAFDADDAGDKAAGMWATRFKGYAITERFRPQRGKDWNDEIMQ